MREPLTHVRTANTFARQQPLRPLELHLCGHPTTSGTRSPWPEPARSKPLRLQRVYGPRTSVPKNSKVRNIATNCDEPITIVSSYDTIPPSMNAGHPQAYTEQHIHLSWHIDCLQTQYP